MIPDILNEFARNAGPFIQEAAPYVGISLLPIVVGWGMWMLGEKAYDSAHAPKKEPAVEPPLHQLN